jgi:thymidylate synthase
MRQWHDLLRRIKSEGEPHSDRTGVGTMSVFGHEMRFDMRRGFPIATTKRIPLRWIYTELAWMLAGSTDANELVAKEVHTWDKWATAEKCAEHDRQPGDLGPTYGWLLRHFAMERYLPTQQLRILAKLQPDLIQGVDQLWELAYNMDVDPYSRRHVVVQHDPATAHLVDVPPCQPLWQVRLHEPDEISLRVDQRSADSFVGLPWDIAHYGLLLEMLGYCTSRQPRELVFHIGDAHIYSNHSAMVNELLEREPRKLPWLTIDKQMWHAVPGAPGQDTFVNMLQIKWEHVRLMDYDPWPAMKAEVAV